MHILRKTVVLCGLVVMASIASANMGALDATISIDRALNSPTITVKYSGANASLVELRINGDSIATRAVAQDKDNGETNFTIDFSSLKDGENVIEIRLYDKSGRMVGSERNTLAADDSSTPAPFFLEGPKMGATVLGPVEISVGFGKTFAGSFVSFYIDNKLRAAINTPPFSYLWDTATETNGWHELESLLVDDSNTTYRSKKIRVFVNNPHGNTERHVEPRQSNDTTVKPNPTPTPAITKVEHTSPELTPSANTPKLAISGSNSGLKPTRAGAGIATGPKFLTPTGTRVATNYTPKASSQGPAISQAVGAVRMIPITHGTRLPNVSSFAILMNGSFVDFDVTPRVDDGVPMTPLRFLFERDGGTVSWNGLNQSVSAKAEGRDVFLKIGESEALVNQSPLQMERAAYLERGRTIVPLSFIREALNVNVQYDKATGHVLITNAKK